MIKKANLLTRPPQRAKTRFPPWQAAGVRDARNNERHVCGRRRDGEPAGTTPGD
jgi:hypothetical protein